MDLAPRTEWDAHAFSADVTWREIALRPEPASVIGKDGGRHQALELSITAAKSDMYPDGFRETVFLDGDLRVIAHLRRGVALHDVVHELDWSAAGGLPPYGVGLWHTVDLGSEEYTRRLSGQERTVPIEVRRSPDLVIDLGNVTAREPSGSHAWRFLDEQMLPVQPGWEQVGYEKMGEVPAVPSYPYGVRAPVIDGAYPFVGVDLDPLGAGESMEAMLQAAAEASAGLAARLSAQECVGWFSLRQNGQTTVQDPLGQVQASTTLYQGIVRFPSEGFRFSIAVSPMGMSVEEVDRDSAAPCPDVPAARAGLGSALDQAARFGFDGFSSVTYQFWEHLDPAAGHYATVWLDGSLDGGEAQLRYDLTNAWLVRFELPYAASLPSEGDADGRHGTEDAWAPPRSSQSNP